MKSFLTAHKYNKAVQCHTSNKLIMMRLVYDNGKGQINKVTLHRVPLVLK